MAYEKTTWNDGDLITAAKLNKLEDGVLNEQVGPQGPQGPKGEGLTGSATAITDIADPSSATAQDIATKVNELLAALRTRGVIS